MNLHKRTLLMIDQLALCGCTVPDVATAERVRLTLRQHLVEVIRDHVEHQGIPDGEELERIRRTVCC